jgi:hypothetical protein
MVVSEWLHLLSEVVTKIFLITDIKCRLGHNYVKTIGGVFAYECCVIHRKGSRNYIDCSPPSSQSEHESLKVSLI